MLVFVLLGDTFTLAQRLARFSDSSYREKGPEASDSVLVFWDENEGKTPVLRLPRKFDREKRSVLKPLPLNWQFAGVPHKRAPAKTSDHHVSFILLESPNAWLLSGQDAERSGPLEQRG